MSKVSISADSPFIVGREIHKMLAAGGKLVNNRELIRILKLGPQLDFEDESWTEIQKLVKAGKVSYKAAPIAKTNETIPTPAGQFKQGDLGKAGLE